MINWEMPIAPSGRYGDLCAAFSPSGQYGVAASLCVQRTRCVGIRHGQRNSNRMYARLALHNIRSAFILNICHVSSHNLFLRSK